MARREAIRAAVDVLRIDHAALVALSSGKSNEGSAVRRTTKVSTTVGGPGLRVTRETEREYAAGDTTDRRAAALHSALRDDLNANAGRVELPRHRHDLAALEPSERARVLATAFVRAQAGDSQLEGSVKALAKELALSWAELMIQAGHSRALRMHLAALAAERRPLLFNGRRWRVEGPPDALVLELDDFADRRGTYQLPPDIGVYAELDGAHLSERARAIRSRGRITAGVLGCAGELHDFWADEAEAPMTILELRPLAVFETVGR